MEAKRIEYIDFAKGIAILLVVVGHCYWIKEFQWLHLTIYSFHMPLFFIISGYFAKELSIKDAVIKFSKSYLTPLIVTSVIALLLVVVGDFIRHDSITETITSWMKQLALMTGNQEELNVTKITPLWFLMALFWGSVVFAQILKLTKTNQLIVVLCGLTVVSVLDLYAHLPLMIEEGILSVLFLWIGRNISDSKIIQKNIITYVGWIALLLVWLISIPCGPFFFKTISFGHLYVTIMGSIAASVIILKLCCKLEDKVSSGWIGRNTLNILCGHVISFNLLKMTGFRWESINTPPTYVTFIIEIVTMISLAIIIAWGIAHIKPYKR